MTEIDCHPINPEVIISAYSFQESILLMQKVASNETTPGNTVPTEYKHLIKLNYQRMKRVYKTCVISKN